MAQEAAAAEAKLNPVVEKMEAAMAGFVGGGKLSLGNYGYAVRGARGMAKYSAVAAKNQIPKRSKCVAAGSNAPSSRGSRPRRTTKNWGESCLPKAGLWRRWIWPCRTAGKAIRILSSP